MATATTTTTTSGGDTLSVLHEILTQPALFTELTTDMDHGYMLKLRRLGRSVNAAILSADAYWLARIDAKLSAGRVVVAPAPPKPVAASAKTRVPRGKSRGPTLEHEEDEDDGAFAPTSGGNGSAFISESSLQDQKARQTTYQIINLMLKNEELWPDIRCIPPFRIFWAMMTLYNLVNVHTALEMQCAPVEKKRAWKNEEERFFNNAHFFNQSLVDLEKVLFYYVPPTESSFSSIYFVVFTNHAGTEHAVLQGRATTEFTRYAEWIQAGQRHVALLHSDTGNLLAFHLAAAAAAADGSEASREESELLHSRGSPANFMAAFQCYARLSGPCIPGCNENLCARTTDDDEEKVPPAPVFSVRKSHSPLPYNCLTATAHGVGGRRRRRHLIGANRLRKNKREDESRPLEKEEEQVPAEDAPFVFLARPLAASNIRVGEIFLDPAWIHIDVWIHTLASLLSKTVFGDRAAECVYPLREDQLFLVATTDLSFLNEVSRVTDTAETTREAFILHAFGLDGSRKNLFTTLAPATASTASSQLRVSHLGRAHKTSCGLPALHWSQAARDASVLLRTQMDQDFSKLYKRWEREVAPTAFSDTTTLPWQNPDARKKLREQYACVQKTLEQQFDELERITCAFETGTL